jgi:hypothetical protein
LCRYLCRRILWIIFIAFDSIKWCRPRIQLFTRDLSLTELLKLSKSYVRCRIRFFYRCLIQRT